MNQISQKEAACLLFCGSIQLLGLPRQHGVLGIKSQKLEKGARLAGGILRDNHFGSKREKKPARHIRVAVTGTQRAR